MSKKSETSEINTDIIKDRKPQGGGKHEGSGRPKLLPAVTDEDRVFHAQFEYPVEVLSKCDFTIDQIRNNKSLLDIFEKYNIIIVIAGMAVPGRYLSGYPASPNELVSILKDLTKPLRILTGPAAKYGFGISGGKKTRFIEYLFDIIADGDGEIIISEILKNKSYLSVVGHIAILLMDVLCLMKILVLKQDTKNFGTKLLPLLSNHTLLMELQQVLKFIVQILKIRNGFLYRFK